MLSEPNYALLTRFRSGTPILQSDFPPSEELERIRWLEEQHLLNECPLPSPTGRSLIYHWKISTSGLDALKEFEEHAAQQAKEKTDKHKERWFQIALVVLGCLLGIAGTLFLQVFI